MLWVVLSFAVTIIVGGIWLVARRPAQVDLGSVSRSWIGEQSK